MGGIRRLIPTATAKEIIMENKETIQEKINNIQKIYSMDELTYLPQEIHRAVMIELSKGLVKYYKKLQKLEKTLDKQN